MTSRRNALLGLITVGLTLGLTVLLLEIALQLLPVLNTPALQDTDPDYQVNRFIPGSQVDWSTGWNFAHATRKQINNAGFPSDRDYVVGATRPLALIGDSYVEALQVANNESLHGLLDEAAVVPVYGIGTSGAQLPTYLAYAAYAREAFQPRALALVIISNDFDESACAHARFRSATWCFEFDESGTAVLALRNQPPRSAFRRLLGRSALLRYLTFNLGLQPGLLQRASAAPAGGAGPTEFVANVPRSLPPERVTLARQSIDAFLAQLPNRSGLPPDRIVFLLDGIREDIYAGQPDGAGSFVDEMRVYFSAAAGLRGYEVVDLQPAFAADHAGHGERFDYPTDRHWNALGHWIAAKALAGSRVGREVLGDSVELPRP